MPCGSVSFIAEIVIEAVIGAGQNLYGEKDVLWFGEVQNQQEVKFQINKFIQTHRTLNQKFSVYFLLFYLPSIAFRKSLIVSAGSTPGLKSEDPATITFAPAFAAACCFTK